MSNSVGAEAGSAGQATPLPAVDLKSAQQWLRRALLHWRVRLQSWRLDAAEKLFPARTEMARLEAAFTALCAHVEGLHTRIHELEERTRLPQPGERNFGVNLTTKTLAQKLSRNGQDPRRIADTLGMPLGEVLLVLKVAQMQAAVVDPGVEDKGKRVSLAEGINNAAAISIKKKKREAAAKAASVETSAAAE